MDILPMQQDETGISVLLTAQNLPVAGEYTLSYTARRARKRAAQTASMYTSRLR